MGQLIRFPQERRAEPRDGELVNEPGWLAVRLRPDPVDRGVVRLSTALAKRSVSLDEAASALSRTLTLPRGGLDD